MKSHGDNINVNTRKYNYAFNGNKMNDKTEQAEIAYSSS